MRGRGSAVVVVGSSGASPLPPSTTALAPLYSTLLESPIMCRTIKPISSQRAQQSLTGQQPHHHSSSVVVCYRPTSSGHLEHWTSYRVGAPGQGTAHIPSLRSRAHWSFEGPRASDIITVLQRRVVWQCTQSKTMQVCGGATTNRQSPCTPCCSRRTPRVCSTSRCG